MRKVYSHTKRSTIDRCVLQYFYEYYAAGFDSPVATKQQSLFEDAPSVEHRRLQPHDSTAAAGCKTLSSAYQTAGQVLHNVLAQHWEHPDWQSEWFERAATERFDRIVAASLVNSDQGGSPGSRLMEHHYRLPDADEILTAARAKLVVAVANYFGNPAVSELVRELLSGDECGAEASIGGLPRIGDFTISGRIDGWSRKGERIRIVDWKMGSSVGDEDSLQLVLYGWWAVERFHVLPEHVSVQRVFLGDGVAETPLVISERLIERCRARLRQDVERMEQLHDYGVHGNYEAFPPCEKEKICRQCKYQGMCVAVAPLT